MVAWSCIPQVDDLLNGERSKSRFARSRDASRAGALKHTAITPVCDASVRC